MIIVPEIKTVVLLVPRTGSGSLKRAVLARYPRAMELYRHMEADGVPFGYDRWRKVGVVRNPVDRLWSLYKFLQTRDFNYAPQTDLMRGSVARPFEDWLLSNEIPFQGNSGHLKEPGRHPHLSVRYPMAENRKSQEVYLRPDLGTAIYRFTNLAPLARELGVELPCVNTTTAEPAPTLSIKAHAYLRDTFAWDFANA